METSNIKNTPLIIFFTTLFILILTGFAGVTLAGSDGDSSDSDGGNDSGIDYTITDLNNPGSVSQKGTTNFGDALFSATSKSISQNGLSNLELDMNIGKTGNQMAFVNTECSGSCGGGGNMQFFSNGDGTYNTITYTGESTDSGDDNGAGTLAGTSYGGCPSGTTLYNGVCYENSMCTNTPSGGKGGVVTTCAVPSTPPAASNATTNGPGGSSNDDDSPFSAANPPASSVLGISISVAPPIIRSGESVTVTWDGGSSDTCTVSGPPSFTDTRISGEAEVADVLSSSSYTLTCALGSVTESVKAAVRVLPRIQES